MTTEDFNLLQLNTIDVYISPKSKLPTHAVRIQSHIKKHVDLPLYLRLQSPMLFSGGSVWLFSTIHLLFRLLNFNGIVVVNIATSRYTLIPLLSFVTLIFS